MRSNTKLERLKKVSRKITQTEHMECNLQMFEQLGLNIDDLRQMAESVGLKTEDLLLLNTHVSVRSEKPSSCSVDDFNWPDDTIADISENLRKLRSEVHDVIRKLSLVNPLGILSPLERELYDATDIHKALQGKAIAAKIKHSCDSSTRTAISTLVKMRLLKKVRGGYIRQPECPDMSVSTD